MNWNRYLTLCIAIVGLLLALASPGRAQITQLDKDGSLYVVQQPTNQSSTISRLDRTTSPYTLRAFTGAATGTTILNALGYNRVDGFMYVLAAPTSATNALYRVGKATGGATAGEFQTLGAISGLPNATYYAGAVSYDGYYYLSNSAVNASNTIYRVNLNQTPYAATAITLPQTIKIGDFTFGKNGTLYALSLDGTSLYQISVSPSSNAGSVVTRAVSNVPTGLVIGTLLFDGAQELYAYDNNGGFFVVDVNAARLDKVSTATPVAQSDGASVTDTPEFLDIIKSAGAPTQLNATTFDVPYVIGVKNTGQVTAPNVQVNDNLRLAFGSGNPALAIVSNPRLTATQASGIAPTLNQNFNGDTDTKLFAGTDDYPSGAIVRVAFTVRVTYPNFAAVPETAQLNSAYVSAVAGTTYTNAGYTYSGTGVAVAPVNAVTGESSSPGTVFPTSPQTDTPGGTGITVPAIALTGRVYEDPNFGGGAGRAFNAAQGMAGAANARVEIYSSTGAFVGAVNSAADGTWSYGVATPGNYYARVVNSSVLSTRTGGTAALIGTQTFRTNNGAALTTEVGGRAPQSADAPAGANGTTLNTTTFQLSGGATGPAQSVAPIVVANASDDRTGLDFGFNFDTVVNTNDAGQGSLRQFVLNSNALANTGLAQQGLTAGVETSIFQIPKTDANFQNGVAKITLSSTLVIGGANAASTALDGTTQTRDIGDTNAGTFGTGGTVGVQNVPLPTLARPEIEIYGARAVPIGVDIEADSALVRGVAVWGFGDGGDNANRASIRAGSGGGSSYIGPVIREVLLGTSAVPDANGALVVPGAGLYGVGDLVRANGVKNGQVLNSIIGYSGGKGIALNSGADGWLLQGNEIIGNSRNSIVWDNIDAQTANNRIIANLVYLSNGTGIDSYSSSGGTLVRNNTSRNNGQGCTPTTGEPAGIRSYGTGNTIDFNIVYHNYGAGILVQSTATALISRNSIYGNGQFSPTTAPGVQPSLQIGIDLLKSGDAVDHGTKPYVTPNDASDPDVGANGLLNFPVITGYEITGGQLTLQGFAPPGATVELFVADPDASGFGQGKTYQFSFVEGSADDTDNTTGAYNSATLQAAGYPAAVANLAGGETAANRFRIVVPAGGLAANTPIAATATLNNVTSEFSLYTGTIPIGNAAAPTVSGSVYLDSNRNGTLDGAESGTNLNNLFVKAILSGQTSATQAVAVNAATGAFQFSGLAAGNYTLILDDNATLTDITPAMPAGYVGTQSPDGTRQVTFSTQTVQNQNFGLYLGAQISGTVFEDNGAGGGIANDGLKNGGELGLAGIKLNLTKSDGTVLDGAVTDASGNYSFRVPNNLASSSLKVVETNGADFVSSGAQVGNSGGTYDRPADAITFNYTAGATYSGLNFGDVRLATLDGGDSKTAPIGSSVDYAHLFRAQTAGTVTFSASQLSSPNNPDWSVVAFQDSNDNGILDGADARLPAGPIAVTAGQQIRVLLQNFVPQTAANGAQDKLTLSANFVPTGTQAPAPQVLTRNDTTTVSAAQGLVLTKTVDKATARSGDVLLYTITYKNSGAEALTNLIVNDATPAYTTFVSAASGALPAGLTGATIAAPAVGARGAVKWTFGGSLTPGASGAVTFRVTVQ